MRVESIPFGWGERFAVAIDGFLHVLGEVCIHDGGGCVSLRQSYGFREQAPLMRFRRAHYRNGPASGLNYNFGALADARQYRGEIANRFGLRDADSIFCHQLTALC